MSSELSTIDRAVNYDQTFMARVRVACFLEGYDGMLPRFYHFVAKRIAHKFTFDNGRLITDTATDEDIINAVRATWEEIGHG